MYTSVQLTHGTISVCGVTQSRSIMNQAVNKRLRDKNIPCAICGAKRAVNVDHIIPKWLWKNAAHIIPYRKKRKYTGQNTQFTCRECNWDKSGGISVEHETGLNFWLDVREEINRHIRDVYGK